MTELYEETPLASNGKSKARLLRPSYRREDAAEYSLPEAIGRLWRRLQLNEFTFTLMLFLFALSVVVGKLFLNYDFFSFLDSDFDRSVNKSHPYYKDIADKAVVELHRLSWFFKAALSGLATVGLTWFIIYQDSHVPGVNPPTPFRSSKKRISEMPSLQLNYFVGILIGFMIFLYMCL